MDAQAEYLDYPAPFQPFHPIIFAIRVYALYRLAAGNTPGALVASIIGPNLVDRSLNQFNVLDRPANNIPLMVPVTSGQTFVVAMEFLIPALADSRRRSGCG